MILPEKKTLDKKNCPRGQKGKVNIERNGLPHMSNIKFTGSPICRSIKQLSMLYCCVTSTSAFDSYFTNQKDFGRAIPNICAAKVLLFFIIPCILWVGFPV